MMLLQPGDLLLVHHKIYVDYVPLDVERVLEVSKGTIGMVLERSASLVGMGTVKILFVGVGIGISYAGHGDESEWNYWFTRLWTSDEG